jgi:allophanate hydrolase
VELGSFLTGIPAPLGLGKVELSDGRWETGFICDTFGLKGAREITSFGGWRRWIASTVPAAANTTSRAVAE